MLASPTMQALGRGIATISGRHQTTLEVWYRDLSLIGKRCLLGANGGHRYIAW